MKYDGPQWMIMISNLTTAEEWPLMDRYGHGPEIFRSHGDAVSRAAKINGKQSLTGQSARVQEYIAPCKAKKA